MTVSPEGSTLIRQSPSEQTEDGEPIFTHIVAPQGPRTGHAIVAEAMVEGTPVTALCGKTWVPSRPTEKYPPCAACALELDRILDGDGSEQ